ncbi:WXG100 family type VII secretion target [Agromyces sp. CFH 90414]|uniref:ESAT-6-like protein n=1 Tax=Agromyces agglutinans TaxID=2662258 RepID=A0A6I2FAV3_9MICO|nr:WXG100 family type VII secretion target [Agromyces agglutinans]MRG59870.1 WXG100 family type VII secretion target [Agromyces agglutinans]
MRERLISVDAAAMQAICTAIEAQVAAIERELDLLERRGAALRDEWNGEAARAFDEAHRRWDRSARELHAIATAISSTARRGLRRQVAQDDAAANVWRR